MILQANSNYRKTNVAILIPNKIDFKVTKVTRHKYGHFIMMKVALHQDDITLLNINAPKQRAPK